MSPFTSHTSQFNSLVQLSSNVFAGSLKVALIAASVGAIALADSLWNPGNRAIAQTIEAAQNSTPISTRAADLSTPIVAKCSGTTQVLPPPPAIANAIADPLPVPSATPCASKFSALERNTAIGGGSGGGGLPVQEVRFPELSPATSPDRANQLQLPIITF